MFAETILSEVVSVESTTPLFGQGGDYNQSRMFSLDFTVGL